MHKPGGSDIALDWKLRSAPAVGQPVTITLTFSNVAEAAGARAYWTIDGALAFAAGTPTGTVLAPGDATSIDVTLLPGAGGYLNVFTQQAGRTSATSIAVGQPAPPASTDSGQFKQDGDKENIISLPVR